jgi:hypothetical protein
VGSQCEVWVISLAWELVREQNLGPPEVKSPGDFLKRSRPCYTQGPHFEKQTKKHGGPPRKFRKLQIPRLHSLRSFLQAFLLLPHAILMGVVQNGSVCVQVLQVHINLGFILLSST